MNKTNVDKLVLASLFLCIGLVLPFFTGNIPQIGAMLLPMHLPVLLCGIILGPKYGALVGLVLPLTRFFMVGMPPLFPIAISMTFELATYGLIIGMLYAKLPKTIPALYASLLGAMVAGRIVWGIAMAVMMGLTDIAFSFQLFMAGAVINALPGIVLQIVFVPSLVMILRKAGWQREQLA